MRRIFIGAIILLSTLYCYSQANLVPNSSFELKNCCPHGANQNHDQTSGTLEIPCLANWTMPDRGFLCQVGSADFGNLCDTDYSLYFPINPRTGDGLAGMILYCSNTCSADDYREYITVELTAPLTKWHKYYVEFYAAKGVGVSVLNIGAWFSNDRPKVCHQTIVDGNPTPQIQNSDDLIGFNDWTLISGYYTATDNYNWMTIGNFDNDDNTIISTNGDYSYYFIDDVKVIDEGIDCCPDYAIYQNRNDLPALTSVEEYITTIDCSVQSGQTVTFLSPSWTAQGSWSVSGSFQYIQDQCNATTTPTGQPINIITASNIFSPNGDGINDQWCIEVENAQYYEVTIYNRWGGDIVFHDEGNVGIVPGNIVCIWDATTNELYNTYVTDGTYFYILKFSNCDHENEIASFVEVTGSSGKTDETNDTTSTNEQQILEESVSKLEFEGIKIVPNPNSGIFTLQANNTEAKSITVQNLLGNTVYQSNNTTTLNTEIDLRSYASGVYIVKVQTQSGQVFVEKVVYR